MKPEILTHPHIPKPLHGLNPRTILGQEWWDQVRQEAYARYDYTCVACGVHKRNAKGPKWLEAHEYWKIDYTTGKCEVVSIEPLCHYCHNFIHSGRLSIIVGKQKSLDEVVAILEHGFRILSNNNLKCFPFTKRLAKYLGANTFGVKKYKLKVNPELKWKDYVLILNGKEYYSKWNSVDEWSTHWSR